MRLILIPLIFLLFSLSILAEELATSNTLKAYVRLEHSQKDITIFSPSQKVSIPSIPSTKEIKQQMESLPNGSEVIIEGHIQYLHQSSDVTHRLIPYFVVEKINPLTLKELGQNISISEIESMKPVTMESLVYKPKSIPVSPEVAAAITMTTGFMLMNELTTGNGPDPQNETRNALFLSAGTMATLIFIYDQIQGQ